MSTEKRQHCFYCYFDEVQELIFRRNRINCKPFVSPASHVLNTVCEIAERYSRDRGCKPQDSSGWIREPQSWIKRKSLKMTVLHPSIWLWNPLQVHLKRKKVIWGWFCNSLILWFSRYIFNIKFWIVFPFRQWFCNKLSQSTVNVQDTTFAKGTRKFIKSNIHNIHVMSCCL